LNLSRKNAQKLVNELQTDVPLQDNLDADGAEFMRGRRDAACRRVRERGSKDWSWRAGIGNCAAISRNVCVRSSLKIVEANLFLPTHSPANCR